MTKLIIIVWERGEEGVKKSNVNEEDIDYVTLTDKQVWKQKVK